ncbi:MAG: hypothetical protein KAJ55_11760 [Anaerolineales bacterium]|nr:hypothetical protein [Anaerolineales bacterium]
MAHLFPDMSVKQYDGSEDFIFAAPIARDEWDAMHHHSYITEDKKYRWIRREFQQIQQGDAPQPFVTIILRLPHHSDNQMLEAAAWLRITLECQDRIYAVPFWESPNASLNLTEAMVKTTGAPKHLSIAIEKLQIGEDET